MPHDIYTARLAPEQVPDVTQLIKEITRWYQTVADPAFLAEAEVWAHELPRSLRAALCDFRLREPAGACVVTGFPVDDAALGSTPASWHDNRTNPAVLSAEIFFVLCAQLLGEPFAWATEQRGRVMHQVVPTRGVEDAQLGASSRTALTWHTEDGFHPYRADYVGLMCLRNPDRVQTTYASVRHLRLPEGTLAVLRQPRFVIRPDEAHLSLASLGDPRELGAPAALVQRAYAQVQRAQDDPEPIAALFGDADLPYLRVNSYYMAAVDGDEEADRALRALIDALDALILGLTLHPGEICFLDNYLVVHGREAFRARFDGTDRWLKRLNVTRDLRRSRDLRASAESRLIF